MFSAEKIKEQVEAAFPGARAEVSDLTGSSDHFQLVVVADHFDGKGLIERHRMVYKVLGSAVGAEIHALSLRTLTPAEFQRQKS